MRHRIYVVANEDAAGITVVAVIATVIHTVRCFDPAQEFKSVFDRDMINVEAGEFVRTVLRPNGLTPIKVNGKRQCIFGDEIVEGFWFVIGFAAGAAAADGFFMQQLGIGTR